MIFANSDETGSMESIMRDMSHRAAAALTLGLINDDIFGALMNAPSGATRGTAAVERNRFADYLAASNWLREDDLEVVSRDRGQSETF